MKTMVFLLAGLFTCAVFGQHPEPSFEVQGDRVAATYYHENGAIAQTGFFLDGKRHGEWKMFNAWGTKLAMGQYELGEKNGKWFFWENDGLKEVDFDNNRIANVTHWNTSEPGVLNK